MGDMARTLAAFRAGLMERLDPETIRLIAEHEAVLAASGAGLAAPKAGSIAPNFSLPDQDGRVVDLWQALQAGPVVLTFLKGLWCPLSRITLRAYREALPAIRAAGGSVIGVTPQMELGAGSGEARRLGFPLLRDRGNRAARDWGVAYDLCPSLHAFYCDLGHPLPNVNQSESWEVSLPATFVIATDRRVILADVQLDFVKRLEPKAALDAMRRHAAEAMPA